MLELDGIHSFDFRQNGRLTLAANFRYRSGVPISVRTDTAMAQYRGSYLIYLLPRGEGGRVASNYRVNLTASYSYPLANVTNAKAVLRVDEVYSFEGARPIAGGDLEDLKHAKVYAPGGGDGFFKHRHHPSAGQLRGRDPLPAAGLSPVRARVPVLSSAAIPASRGGWGRATVVGPALVAVAVAGHVAVTIIVTITVPITVPIPSPSQSSVSLVVLDWELVLAPVSVVESVVVDMPS